MFPFPRPGRAAGNGDLEHAVAGRRILAARNGMFSQRWIDMRQRHGLDVAIVEVPWGEGIPPTKGYEILTAKGPPDPRRSGDP